MTLSNIKNKLKMYEVISFDVFDTLINRCVGNPHNIFLVMESVLCERYSNDYIGFAKKRITAEHQANKFSDKEEISLAEIYKYLDIKRKDIVCQLEKDIEIELSVVNIEIFKIYQECINQKKRIVICSDMYLDKETIKKILEKNQYTGYEQIYLSSDRNKRKSSGTIYKELINEAGVSPRKILHIGDNFISDCFHAKKEGISAFHYSPVKRYKENYIYPYNIFYGDMPQEFSRNFYWEQVGKYALGNFLFGYSKWLVGELEAGQYDHVFFLSRDGFIVQKAIEMIASEELINKSSYLYVSRRALIVPSLYLYESYKERCEIMFWKKHYTIREFVSNFGIEYEDYKEKIVKFIRNPDYVYKRDELFTNRELLNVYEYLKQAIENNSKKEHDLLIGYLNQEGFAGNVAIVDIGWFGNLQNAIEKNISVTEVKAKVHGYYIGIRDKCKYFNSQEMSAYLYFGQEHRQNQINELGATSIIEALFSHDEGSTKCYAVNGDKVIANLKKNELNKEKCAILNKIQVEALKRVKHLNSITSINFLNFPPEVFFEGFCRVSLKPTVKDAWILGEFVENKNIHGTLYYIIKLNRLKYDTYAMNWKLGQLKRVLRLKCDYMKIYGFIDRQRTVWRKMR